MFYLVIYSGSCFSCKNLALDNVDIAKRIMDCHDEMYLNQPVFRISHTNRILAVDLTLSVLSKIDR